MRNIGKNEAIGIVRNMKRMLESDGIPVRSVFLFGSFARGNAHEWSDIDVAVVHAPFLDSPGKEKSLLFERGKKLDIRLETLSFRPPDFENRYSSIASEVRSHGLEVE